MDPEKKVQSKVLVENAKTLPIKTVSSEKEKFLVNLVNKILFLKQYIRHWNKFFEESMKFLKAGSKASMFNLWQESIEKINNNSCSR